MIGNFEKFQTKIWRTGNSLVITLPDQIVKFYGWKEGDELKVMAKKEG